MIPLPPARMGVAPSNPPKGVVISGPLLESKCGISSSLFGKKHQFSVFFSSYRFLVSFIFVVCWSGGCFWTAVDMVSFLVLFVSTMLVGSELGVRSS